MTDSGPICYNATCNYHNSPSSLNPLNQQSCLTVIVISNVTQYSSSCSSSSSLPPRGCRPVNHVLLASRQRLQLRRFKGDKVSGWDRLHERRGCPHCEHVEDGGSLPHIFWKCPAAQALWQLLIDGWSRFDIWDEKRDVRELLKDAAFNLRLPRFPKGAWELHELACIEKHDTAMTSAIHHAVVVAWQQQIFETWSAIWKWRHNIEQGKQQWTTGMAQSYLSKVLRSSLRGVGDKLPQVAELRGPRRPLLAWLARGFEEEDGEQAHQVGRQHVLFFEGGSRGNPGPGGAGAVIIETDQDALGARVVWSACMSYAQADMTNNRAEYLGAIAGLRAAKEKGWNVEVVGDSNLILRQLREYWPPRHPLLRPLYAEASRLADHVRVDVLQHHVRAYNKMADQAANIAMDQQASCQTTHLSSRPHAAVIESLLASDYHEWHTRHLQRSART